MERSIRLPISFSQLSRLLEICDDCIAAIAQIRRARMAQLEVVSQERMGDSDAELQEQQLRQFRETELRLRTRISIEVLTSYFCPDCWRAQIDLYQRQDQEYSRLCEGRSDRPLDRAKRMLSLTGLIWGDTCLLRILYHVHEEITRALEGTPVRGHVKLPENPAVIQLASRIASRPGDSRREVALELTDGDLTKAESLLRQVRRHRKVFSL